MLPATDDLLRLLSAGPLSAAEIGARLGMSQPTVSRRLTQGGAAILTIGPPRQRRYARRRLEPISIFRVNPQGRLESVGALVPAMPAGFVFQSADPARHPHWYGSLPWWLHDMRPQGFLGRAFARRHGPAFALAPDPREWSDDQVLLALGAAGEDGVGNLLVGDAMRQAWLNAPAPAEPPEPLPAWYARLAAEAERGDQSGSSAGGEQPKFVARYLAQGCARHVLVKFTSDQANPVVDRWRSLLACEHLALEALRKAGLPAAASRILDHAGRRFLEVERFDRLGDVGRRGLVSLAALDAEFAGRADAAWPEAVRVLREHGRVDDAGLESVERLYAFGVLIGNGDMHLGNLSFHHDGPMPYALAPAYDMLPMSLAPRSSGALPDSVDMRLPATPGKAVWEAMLPVASAYWDTVLQSPLIDAAFTPLAQHMAERVTQAARIVQKLA